MPRFTQKYMVENFARVSDECDLLNLYLYDTQTGRTPDAVESCQDDGDIAMTIQLWRSTSAHGGYIVMHKAVSNIFFLDDMNQKMRDSHSEHTLSLRICLERLTAFRNRALEEKHGRHATA